LFDIQSDNSFGDYYSWAGAPQPIFNNDGTFKKTNSTGTTTFYAQFNNTGNVNVESGTLSLQGGGTSSGDITVNDGAAIAFSSGSYGITAGTLNGNGQIAITGASVTLESGIVSNVSNINLSSGTLNFNGTESSSLDNLSLSGGELTGTGDVVVNNNFDWSNGTLS
ncbi:MAG: hypothetical protein ACKO2V_15780, partial [Snowella sp.]